MKHTSNMANMPPIQLLVEVLSGAHIAEDLCRHAAHAEEALLDGALRPLLPHGGLAVHRLQTVSLLLCLPSLEDLRGCLLLSTASCLHRR